MADNILQTTGIRQFYQRAIRHGFARDFQFRVLRMGAWLSEAPGEESPLLYLSSATMPGRTVTPISVPYIGLNFQVPGAANYNSNNGWAVTFRCDETLKIRNLLEDWSRAIFDDATSTGSTIPDNSINNDVELVAIDNQGNARKTITLRGAWVTNVGDLSYNLGGTGAVVTCNATIAYQFWEETGPRKEFRPLQPIENGALQQGFLGPTANLASNL